MYAVQQNVFFVLTLPPKYFNANTIFMHVFVLYVYMDVSVVPELCVVWCAWCAIEYM